MTDTSKEAIELSVSALRKIAEDQRCHARDEWDDSDCIDRAADRLAALRAELDGAKEEIERLRNAMQWALDTVTIEINPSNYDHDDVCRLNAEMIEAVLGIQAALKGTSDD